MTTHFAPPSSLAPRTVPSSETEVVVDPIKQALSLVALTTVVLFAFAFVATWWAAGDVLGSIGVAAFCAAWGGPGFGVMVAGAAWDQGQTEV